MDGVVRVLYRLPDVLKAKAGGKPIVCAEGEKDCDSLAEQGFAATCNPGGAGKWQDSFSETLRGADVVIIPDRDKPGRDHAELVAGKLHGVAKSIRVIELPDANGKPVKDAADDFNAAGDAGANPAHWPTPRRNGNREVKRQRMTRNNRKTHCLKLTMPQRFAPMKQSACRPKSSKGFCTKD